MRGREESFARSLLLREKNFSSAYSDMLCFIVIVKFQSQRSDGRVVGEQRLFGDDPNMACICHVVEGSVPEDNCGILFAASRKCDVARSTVDEIEEKEERNRCINTFNNIICSRTRRWGAFSQ